MFDSGYSAQSLIDGIKSEADIALPIPDETYVLWLNELEQLLYSEVFMEQDHVLLQEPFDERFIRFADIPTPEGQEPIAFEDVYAVYARAEGHDVQLILTPLASGQLINRSYCKHKNDLQYLLDFQPEEILLIYHCRPKKHAILNNTIQGNVMLPYSFLDLARAKLRGEAYKLANEDAMAAKWLNDYNVLLETLKAWVAGKAPQYGM